MTTLSTSAPVPTWTYLRGVVSETGTHCSLHTFRLLPDPCWYHIFRHKGEMGIFREVQP